MDNPQTTKANWKTQYQISFAANPAEGGTTTPSNEIWIDESGSPTQISASASQGYHFTSWSGTMGITITNTQSNATTITTTAPGTVTANFTIDPIPEFPPNFLLLLFMLMLSLLIIGFKKKARYNK